MEWWQEKYEFFGDFYHFGDHSIDGYNPNNKVSFEQRTKNEIDWIISLLNPKRGSSFLDCPCGSGRHSFALSEKGFKVTGIDINSKMLSYTKDFNRINSAYPQFMQMDMRKLELSDQSFDYVINMFISFGFFENDNDNLKVASEFYRVLKPNGQLFLHLDLNYDNVINQDISVMQNISRQCKYKGEHKSLEIKETYNPKTKRLEGKWVLANGASKTKEYSLRIYDNEKEFIPLFQSVGFREVVLVDPIRVTVDSDTVDTILIAKK